MFIQAHKLKRDYKVTYTLEVDKDSLYYDTEYTMMIRDCLTYDEAYERFCDNMAYACDTIDIEAVSMSKQQYVNEQVYELVLAELFDGDIAVNGWLDDNSDNWEINEDLKGVEKIMIEHQAYLKYNELKGQ